VLFNFRLEQDDNICLWAVAFFVVVVGVEGVATTMS
jgi:hypothetical protein